MKVELDKSDILKVRSMLNGIKGGADTAIYRSINKGISHGKTQAVKAIGQELNLKAGRIKQDFTVKKAYRDNLSGSVTATGKPVGLAQFGASARKTGVSVKVKKKGSRKLLKHAFIRKVKGVDHLFWRQYDGPRKKVRPGLGYARLPRAFRFPIERLEGPRIEDIYDEPMVYNPVFEAAAKKTADNLMSEAENILRRYA